MVFGIVVGWTLIQTATGMIYALVARVNPENLLDIERRPMSRRLGGLIAVDTLLRDTGDDDVDDDTHRRHHPAAP